MSIASKITPVLTLMIGTSLMAGCTGGGGDINKPPPPAVQRVATLAGSVLGTSDGQGAKAQFNTPGGIAVDRNGALYVADTGNNSLRQITPSGYVSTMASGSDGAPDDTLKTTQFTALNAVAMDVAGNVYTAEANRIRKVTPTGGVTTIAGGTTGFRDGQGTEASFGAITGIAVDVNGVVYAADSINHAVRKISASGAVTTLVGNGGAGYTDGKATSAKLNLPCGVAVDTSFNVFVADKGNNAIRKITYSGDVSTVAGTGPANIGAKDGPATLATFNGPQALTLDSTGILYVAETSQRIRRVSATGDVTTLAGTGEPGYIDGDALKSKFFMPIGLALRPDGRGLFISDQQNNRIRLLDL